MGQDRVEGYALGFKEGWDKSLDIVNAVIDDFCFGDTEESIEVKRELKKAILLSQLDEVALVLEGEE